LALDSPSAAALVRARPPLLDTAGFDLAGDEEKAATNKNLQQLGKMNKYRKF